MKPFKTSLVLLGLVLVLGGYAWLFEIKKPPKEREEKALAVKAADVRGIVLQRPDTRLAFARDEGQWRMTSPFVERADEKALDELLAELETLEVFRRLPGARPGAELGLSPPQASLLLEPGGGLMVGAISPDGQTAYAMHAGETEVFLIPKEFAGHLQKPVNDFRHKALLDARRERAVRISLAYPDRRIAAELGADGGWLLTEPFPAAAGGEEVGRVIDGFLQILSETWVSDGVKDWAPYGLDKPRFELKVWEKGRAEPSGFAVGATSQERYPFDAVETFYFFARPLGTDSVVTVKVRRLEDLMREPRHFRSPGVFSVPWDAAVMIEISGPAGTLAAERDGASWRATAPHPGLLDAARWKDALETPLRSLRSSGFERKTPERARALGLDRPVGRITIAGSGGRAQILEVGRIDPETLEAPASPSGEAVILHVSGLGEILSLPSRYADLRDRAILALPLASVRSLRVETPEGTRAYEPVSGGWVETAPERRLPKGGPLPGIEALAAGMASLTAEGWASFGDVPWAGLGLAPPRATVFLTYAVGLDASSERSVALGARDAASGAVYGRVDGGAEAALLPARLLDLALGDPAKAP